MASTFDAKGSAEFGASICGVTADNEKTKIGGLAGGSGGGGAGGSKSSIAWVNGDLEASILTSANNHTGVGGGATVVSKSSVAATVSVSAQARPDTP